MKTPEEFLQSKGWDKHNPVFSGALFIGLCEIIEEYANLYEYESCKNCAAFIHKDDLKKRNELIKAQDELIYIISRNSIYIDTEQSIDLKNKIEQLKKEIQ